MQRYNKCAICGKNLYSRSNMDHFFPRAIYKWTEELLPYEEYQRVYHLIEDPQNRLRTHESCNFEKEDSVISIDSLHISNRHKHSLTRLQGEISTFLVVFSDLKARVLQRQEYTCYYCKQPLENGVIRRIHPEKRRTEANACIVCHSCNLSHPDFSMVSEESKQLLS